jgi:hypothetical protein
MCFIECMIIALMPGLSPAVVVLRARKLWNVVDEKKATDPSMMNGVPDGVNFLIDVGR